MIHLAHTSPDHDEQGPDAVSAHTTPTAHTAHQPTAHGDRRPIRIFCNRLQTGQTRSKSSPNGSVYSDEHAVALKSPRHASSPSAIGRVPPAQIAPAMTVVTSTASPVSLQRHQHG